MGYRIKTFGWRHSQLDQISRIESGIKELGHEIVESGDCDILYKNNDFFDDAWEYYDKCDKKPFTIFNILDLQLDTWDKSQLEKLNDDLNSCNQVTCISETVKKDIQEVFNIEAKVIYNPIKSVSYIPEVKKDIFGIFVGRANSPNKRVREIIWPLYNNLIKYFGKDCIHFVGSENPGFGVYHKIVDDKELNNLYNRSLFGLISSKQEGLNLPLLEMIFCNVKPIICKDMATANEFGIPELFCDPTAESMFNKIKEVGTNLDFYDKLVYDYSIKYKEQFSGKSVACRIINIYENAQ